MSERSLFELADDLCKKIREIEQHPNYKAVWQLAHVHGVIYRGPTYTEELEALERFLHGEGKEEPRIKDQLVRLNGTDNPEPVQPDPWEAWVEEMPQNRMDSAEYLSLQQWFRKMPRGK